VPRCGGYLKTTILGPGYLGTWWATARCEWSKIHWAGVPFGKCVTLLHILAATQE